jgi:2-polyprenyl-3-methyl-5-hydroxy-6-metoxy-1,4-benzoquinol methylase
MDDEYTLDDHEFRKDDSYARSKYNLTAQWLADTPRGRVLVHVGCGSGLFNHTAVDLGFEVVAYEPDPSAAALAEQARPAGCVVHCAPLEEIEGEGFADVIVMHDVLEHIEDERGAVEHLARLLKPGGRLILSVPAVPALFGYHDVQLGHFRRYRRRSLRAALEPRFRITRLRYFGFSFLPVTLVFSRLLKRPYPTSAAGEATSMVGRAFDRLCLVEERVAMPLGTSLLCDAVRA